MPSFDHDTVTRWKGLAREWLFHNAGGKGLQSVETGHEAWDIAHKCGITREAYADHVVLEACVQTALQMVFPRVTFLDSRRH